MIDEGGRLRWDSDRVVLIDDEMREIAKEIVRDDAEERVAALRGSEERKIKGRL